MSWRRAREILMSETPYNPLDKKNLGISVADAMRRGPFPNSHQRIASPAPVSTQYTTLVISRLTLR